MIARNLAVIDQLVPVIDLHGDLLQQFILARIIFLLRIRPGFDPHEKAVRLIAVVLDQKLILINSARNHISKAHEPVAFLHLAV